MIIAGVTTSGIAGQRRQRRDTRGKVLTTGMAKGEQYLVVVLGFAAPIRSDLCPGS